jgi:myo-inositol-1(or 4)-monophosphatase
VNDLLHKRLTAIAPSAFWISEESPDHLPDRTLPQAWIVDPIDGTRAYISGRHDWTISVALTEGGRPIVASIYAPVTDELFLVSSRGGATLNGTPMKVSSGESLGGARLAGPKRYLDRLLILTPDMQAQPKIHSLALRLARVAHGELDAALASPGSHDWDLAAADLLVHEAGAVLTDFDGHKLVYNRSEIRHGELVAAGDELHAPLLAALKGEAKERNFSANA